VPLDGAFETPTFRVGKDVIMQTEVGAVAHSLDKAAVPAGAPEALSRPGAASGEPKPVVRPEAKSATDAPAFDVEVTRKNLQAAIEHLNKLLASSGRNLGFTMDDVLNRPIVKVTNTQTGELVRQIPSDAVIKAAHTLEELKGLLYDASS